MQVEVVEYTDPWCSWAWGTEPKLRRLRWRYPDRFAWRTVMGDLVADRQAADPSFDPVAAAPRTAHHWEHVHQHTGMPWPDGLEWAPRASAEAARAVKAAQRQSDSAGASLLRALRESCFVHCRPADNKERILALASEVAVPGLDVDRLPEDFDDDETTKAFLADREETRRPNDHVLNLQEAHEGKGNAKPIGDGDGNGKGSGWRYVFPTLLFRGRGGEHTVPGWQPWERYLEAMEAAVPGSTEGGRPDPTVDQARAEWPTLTERELEFICGQAR
jgi:predicted DsbA family dithiol-disulfide isomerase